MERPVPAYRTYHYLTAMAFTGVCAWFAFRVGQRPPGLTYLDIAVHEVGHVVFRPFGELTMLMMGSGSQVLFPLALAAFALAYRRDLLAGAVLLVWAGEAMGDAATYIADAPRGQLPLLGVGGEGDWTRILGPEHLARMHLADSYARDVRIAGVLTMLLAVGLCAYGIWRLRDRSTKPRADLTTASTTPMEMWRGPVGGGGRGGI